MKIGKVDEPRTAISGSNPDVIIVRGNDLTAELVGHISFTEHLWLLVTGFLPSEPQRRILDATLVAIAEHGLVPSVAAARMTLAAAPEAIQGAVAAGLLGCGSVILGSSEAAGEFLHEVVSNAEEKTKTSDLQSAARKAVEELRRHRKAIPGFGHPLHKRADPRAKRLFEIAEELGIAGDHTRAAFAVESILLEVTGKDLRINISAAIPAVLLDAGYPQRALKGVPLLARTASLIAHLLEEQSRPIGFIMAQAASAAITYDGPAPDGFVANEN